MSRPEEKPKESKNIMKIEQMKKVRIKQAQLGATT